MYIYICTFWHFGMIVRQYSKVMPDVCINSSSRWGDASATEQDFRGRMEGEEQRPVSHDAHPKS